MLDSFKVLNLAYGSTFENKEHEITLEDEVSLNSEEIKELENKLTKQFPDKKINISPYINFKNSKIYIN